MRISFLRGKVPGGGVLTLLLTGSLIAAANPTPDPDEHLAADPQWQALLHLRNHRPQISDPAFYATRTFVSAVDELKATRAALDQDVGLRCRFPARALWLARALAKPAPDLGPCTDAHEFESRAPADQIAVAFASENISQPASIMGHVLLKLSGKNAREQYVEHGISFFTDLGGVNFPRLAFESLIVGRPGHYALGPYEDVKHTYLFGEQRNLWEYTLNLDEPTRRLVHLHLFELRQIRFTYYFHVFNCSTLVRDIVAVAFPAVAARRVAWVTPLDVVRDVNQADFVRSTRTLVASKWRVRAIRQSLNPSRAVVARVRARDFDHLDEPARPTEARLLTLELALAHNSYLFEHGRIDRAAWDQADTKLTGLREAVMPNAVLDLAQYKTPARTPPDSQLIAAGYANATQTLATLEFVPASHTLSDDNSQYMSESELKIFSPRLSWDARGGRLNLDAFEVYSALALQPSDSLIPAWSTKLRFGYGPGVTVERLRRSGVYTEGAVGKTYRMLGGIDAFGLVGGGYRGWFGTFVLTAEVGLVIREVGGFKTLASYEWAPPISFAREGVQSVRLTQAYRHSSFGLDLKGEVTRVNGQSGLGVELALKHLF